MKKYATDEEWFEAERRNWRSAQQRRRDRYLAGVANGSIVPLPKKERIKKEAGKIPDHVISAASKASGVKEDSIFLRVRYQNITKVRMMIFHYLYTIGIGDNSAAQMSGYERTSVRYLRKKHDDEYRIYEGYRIMYDEFIGLVNAKD